MTWFIFIGDMLVMLFMTVVVVWVSVGATQQTLDYSARIPLEEGTDVHDPLTPVAEVVDHG